MLLEKVKRKVAVGIDLGDEFSQISFCRQDQTMPETISLVMGEEQYNIPTDVQVFSSDEKLEAFIRKMVGFLDAYINGDEIGGVSFTMRELTTELMDRIRAVSSKIFKKSTDIYFLSREDCFFQYMIHQPDEMWIQDVVLFDYDVSEIKSYVLSMNRKTSPVACFIESSRFPQMRISDMDNKSKEEKDKAFLEIARKHCEDKIVTSVFLLGDYFSKEWCKESLKYLCRGRRVFQGNNLFSKGACYGAREKVFPTILAASYIYLSKDKLRANVGMTCDRGQTEIYYPILNAGTSWYEVDKSFDVLLVKGNNITLNIAPIDGHVSRTARILLEGLKVRGNKTNRVGLRFYMENPDAIWLEITDRGFGEFYPSTGQVWKECIPVD